MTYAGDFEKTLADDDWTRLAQYFCDDAVYEVDAPIIGCRLETTENIFAGIKKSLDGMDRRFDSRDIDLTSGPERDGDELRASWTITYHKEGVKPFLLRGRTEARYRDGRIAYMVDHYDQAITDESLAWQAETGVAIDPRYV